MKAWGNSALARRRPSRNPVLEAGSPASSATSAVALIAPHLGLFPGTARSVRATMMSREPGSTSQMSQASHMMPTVDFKVARGTCVSLGVLAPSGTYEDGISTPMKRLLRPTLVGLRGPTTDARPHWRLERLLPLAYAAECRDEAAANLIRFHAGLRPVMQSPDCCYA